MSCSSAASADNKISSLQVVWPQTVGGVAVSTLNFDIQKSLTVAFTVPAVLSGPTFTSFSPTEYTATDPNRGSAVFYRVVAYSSRSPDVISGISSAFQPVGHAGERCCPCCMHAQHLPYLCTSIVTIVGPQNASRTYGMSAMPKGNQAGILAQS